MSDHSMTEAQIAALSARLRSVARALVYEGGDADDLVQDAWLVTLRARTGLSRPLSFLRTVMRRRQARDYRRDLLRQDREALAAQHESLGDDRDLERASTAALVERVMRDIGAPYSEVIEARYYRDLSIPQIAEQLGRPIETIKTQLQRGLFRMRERLDRRAGGRESWALLLLEVALPPEGAPMAGEAPASAGSKAVAIGLSTAALVATAFVALDRPTVDALQPGHSSTASTDPAPPSGAPVVPVLAHADPSTSNGRALEAAQVVVQPVEPGGPEETATIASNQVRLILLIEDAAGQPISKAHVEVDGRSGKPLHGGDVGSDGRLELDIAVADLITDRRLPINSVAISARAPGLAYSEMLAVSIDPGTARTIRIRLDCPSMTFRGTVRDSSGAAIPHAAVSARPATAKASAGSEEGVAAAGRLCETLCDANGVFALDGLAREPQVVQVVAADHPLLSTSEVPGSAGDMIRDYRLLDGGIIAGFATLPDGRPAAGARIWVGGSEFDLRSVLPETRADEDGFFLLRGLRQDSWDIFASHASNASLSAWTRASVAEGEEMGFEAMLQVSPGLRLRVLDAHGEPVPNIPVTVVSHEPYSRWNDLAHTDEQGRVRFVHVPDAALDVRVYPGELSGPGDLSAFRSSVRTGPAEIELILGSDPGSPGRLTGSVFKNAGSPFAGAQVAAINQSPASRAARPSGMPLLGTGSIKFAPVAQDGRFVLADLVSSEYRLLLVSAEAAGAGSFDLGLHTVLPEETSEVGRFSAPPTQIIRFEGHRAGELDVIVQLGIYWQPLTLLPFEGVLELPMFAGTYCAKLRGTQGCMEFPVEVGTPSIIKLLH